MKKTRLAAALANCGAVLKRTKKHFVYSLPNGKTLTVSATPSDERSEQNAMADLRHALGQPEQRLAVVNQPRAKKRKPGRVADVRWPSVSPLAAALTSSGVEANAELQRARADLAKWRDAERDFKQRIFELELQLSSAERNVRELEQLWVVRAYRVVVRVKRTA